MDLDFGHGFVPRIASQNYKAVDRCLGPASLLDAPLDLPWAIVDAQWAEKNQEFLGSLSARVVAADVPMISLYLPTLTTIYVKKVFDACYFTPGGVFGAYPGPLNKHAFVTGQKTGVRRP